MVSSLETALLINQLQERVQGAQKEKGQKRTPRWTRKALEEILTYITDQKFLEDQVTILSNPYPPCMVALKDLKKINLASLYLGIHHHGSYIIVRTISHPVKPSTVRLAIEDESGDVDLLTVVHFDALLSPTEVFKKDTVIAIKEPFYSASRGGGYDITVDHPSDIVFLDQNHELYPDAWKLPKVAFEWKMLGDRLLGKDLTLSSEREPWSAAVSYGLGLQSPHLNRDQSLESLILGNRAEARLMLKQFEAARKDALMAIPENKDKTLEIKYLTEAGKVSYELGQFGLAHLLYKEALDISFSDIQVWIDLEKTRLRIKEQETGKFDFDRIKRISEENGEKLSVDAASFLRRTEIRVDRNGLRGLYATQDINAGDIVLVEKAFAIQPHIHSLNHVMIHATGIRGHLDTECALWNRAIHKAFRNPDHGARLLDLDAGPQYPPCREQLIIDGAPAVDVFRIKNIVRRNHFTTPKATGLWLQSAYINHLCSFNAARTFIGDLLILRATKDIASEDQITIAYVPFQSGPQHMQQVLLSEYEFTCTCQSCLLEDRRTLKPHHSPDQQTVDHKSVQALAELEASAREDEKIYSELAEPSDHALMPRPGLIRPHIALVVGHGKAGNPAKAAFYAKAVLRDFGWELKVKRDGEWMLEGRHGHLEKRVVDILDVLRAFTVGKEGIKQGLQALISKLQGIIGEGAGLRGLDVG